MQNFYLKTFKETFLLSSILSCYSHVFFCSVKQKEQAVEEKAREDVKGKEVIGFSCMCISGKPQNNVKNLF